MKHIVARANRKLKKLVAEQALGSKEVLKPKVHRTVMKEIVNHFGLSQRRFSRLTGWNRATFQASTQGEVSALEGVEQDVRAFFGRPIAKQVWGERKAYFDSEFRHFVDSILESKTSLQ